MKITDKRLLTVAAFVCAGSSAQAAQLLAGWGFPDNSWNGYSTPVPSVVTDSNVGSAGGQLSFDDGLLVEGDFQQPSVQFSSDNYDPEGIFTNASVPNGSLWIQNIPLPGNVIDPNGQSFYFTLNDAAPGTFYQDISLNYYAQAETGSDATLTWYYSTTGMEGTFNLLDSFTYTDSDWTETNISDILSGGQADSIILMATMSDIPEFDSVYLDSLTISGNIVVPEPSTYALLAGAATLLGVMIHRRRRVA